VRRRPTRHRSTRRRRSTPPSSSGAALRVIFGVIFISVGLAILETLPEYECDGAAAATTECSLFAAAEWASVLLFTVEYLLRLLSAPADPDLGGGGRARLRFVSP